MVIKDIMFRGKSKETGEWFFGGVLCHHNESFILTVEDLDDNSWTTTTEEVSPETVGQSINLRDKNGSRVFEGDILKHTYSMFNGEKIEVFKLICFDEQNEQLVCDSRSGGRFEDGKHHIERCFIERSEVIGNIYDNPELWQEVQKYD